MTSAFGMTSAGNTAPSKPASTMKDGKQQLERLVELDRSFDAVESLKDQVISEFERIEQRITSNPFLSEDKLDTPNMADKDHYFEDLFRDYGLVAAGDKFVEGKGLAVGKCQQTLRGELDAVVTAINQNLIDFPPINKEIFKKIASRIDVLASFAKTFDDSVLKSDATQKHKDVMGRIRQKMTKFANDTQHAVEEKLQKVEDFKPDLADNLKRLQRVFLELPAAGDEAETEIGEVLSFLKKQVGGGGHITQMGLYLNGDTDPLAKMLLHNQQEFQGYAAELRNQATNKMTVDMVLNELKHDDQHGTCCAIAPTHTQYLKSHEETYQKIWWEKVVEPAILELNKAPYQDDDGTTIEKRDVVKKVKQDIVNRALMTGQGGAAGATAETIVELVALVSAYWTIDSSAMFPNDKVKTSDGPPGSGAKAPDRNNIDMLTYPHSAQVLSILRLFGVDEGAGDTMDLRNQLVEIRTGEGKSVTLAITSIVLALLGFDVSVACYSAYLSERDKQSFKSLFGAFNVAADIEYGTFARLCERFLNKKGDIRKAVTNFLETGQIDCKPVGNANKTSILLIDEVDVFFDQDFYGNCYLPFAEVKGPEVIALAKFVWTAWNDNAKSVPSKKTVQESFEFDQCKSGRFSGHPELLDELVNNMRQDLRTFESSDYLVIDGRIAYKEQDGFSYNVSYGWKVRFVQWLCSCDCSILFFCYLFI